MSAREFLLVLTNVLMGAFVLTCVILVLCSFLGEIGRRLGARLMVARRSRQRLYSIPSRNNRPAPMEGVGVKPVM